VREEVLFNLYRDVEFPGTEGVAVGDLLELFLQLFGYVFEVLTSRR